MTAKDYPITLPFGATSAPYTPSAPHEGTDRGCPVGTAVVVSGTTIALAGYTGAVIPQSPAGSHCHYAKFKNGKLAGGIYDISQDRTYFNPEGAFDITGTVSFAQMNATAGNEVIIQADDGYSYRFLHNSSILIKVGTKIGDDMSQIGDYEARILIKYIYGYRNELDIEGAIPGLVGGESNTVIRMMDSTPTAAAYQKQINEWASDTPADVVPYNGPQLYNKK